MSLYRKLTPAEVLAMIAGAKSNTKSAPVIQEEAPESITPEPPAVAAAKTNDRYKVGQAAYMRAYRARKKAEKAAP